MKDSLSLSAIRNTESNVASSSTCRRMSSAKRLFVRGEVDRYTATGITVDEKQLNSWARTNRSKNKNNRSIDMSISKLKQQVARSENDADLLQPTEIALRRSSSVAHLHARLGSRLKNLGQQSRSPSFCLIFTCRLLSHDRDRQHNWQRTERRQKVSDEKSKKSVRSALQSTVGRVSRSRDLFLFGLMFSIMQSSSVSQNSTAKRR